MNNRMASQSPAVSVLMPVYNTQRYLPSAIRSILCQSFSDFEFLIIDDGSTDSSLDVIERFAKKDTRIKIISRPNTGIVTALNEGLGLARGKYIARMDSDDISLPERIASQVAYLDAHSECLAVGGQAEMIDTGGWPICPVPLPISHELIDGQMIAGYPGAIFHPAAMMRADAVRSLGGYRPQHLHAEDYDLWLRMAEIGKLANLSDVVLRYRLHIRSVSVSFRLLQNQTIAAVHKEACIRRGIDCPSRPVPIPSQDERIDWINRATNAHHWPTAIKHSIKLLIESRNKESLRRVAHLIRGYLRATIKRLLEFVRFKSLRG